MSCNLPEIQTGIYLGCFSQCQQIKTNLIANHTGIHKVEYKRKGVNIFFEFGAMKGTEMFLPNCFNECEESNFKIIDPTNHYYKIEGECNLIIKITPVFFKTKKPRRGCYNTCQKL